MSKKILFIIDDIELKYFEFNDLVTNFWFIKEFLKRNYKVSIAIKSDLFIENAKGCAFSMESYIKDENIFYKREKSKNLINDFDIVFFRPDPPVDINYINACYVFDYVDKNKTLVFNDPTEVKNFNEVKSISLLLSIYWIFSHNFLFCHISPVTVQRLNQCLVSIIIIGVISWSLDLSVHFLAKLSQ